MDDGDGTYTAALRNGTWKFIWGSPGDYSGWYATDGTVTESPDDDSTGMVIQWCYFWWNMSVKKLCVTELAKALHITE